MNPALTTDPSCLSKLHRRRRRNAGSLGAVSALATLIGCAQQAAPAPAALHLSRDQLLDPETCQGCHPSQYRDWLQSMHAYAADDPVFVAMNQRGQRETNGALGPFCVTCHAPMAERDGKTNNGLNLAQLPQKYRGVTCYFCHTVDAVIGKHNGALGLSSDSSMRGEYRDPVANAAHTSTYSALHDEAQLTSASMCGTCHDVVNAGAAIERTFCEWSLSAFNSPTASGGQTCSQCHMTASQGAIAVAADAPVRRIHAHDFPGVDVPLAAIAGASELDSGTLEGGTSDVANSPNAGTLEGGDSDAASSPYPGMLEGGTDAGAYADANGERAVVQRFLASALQGALCVTQAGGIRVILDPVFLGHAWPSGAAQDRRAWAEVIAYSAGRVVYQSGVVLGATPVVATASDPDLWLLHDQMADAKGAPVHMFWQAASVQGNEIPALATFDRLDPRFYQTHVVQLFPRNMTPLQPSPDRVTLRMRLQPIGFDVLNDLVSSSDLDPAVSASMPTWDVSFLGSNGAIEPGLEWTPQAAASLFYQDEFDQTRATCVATYMFNVGANKVRASDPIAPPACTP